MEHRQKNLYHVIKSGLGHGRILILNKSFDATLSWPTCCPFEELENGDRIPKQLPWLTSPGVAHSLLPKIWQTQQDKYMAHSKVFGREKILSQRKGHYTWAFCHPVPQCNMQTTVLVEPYNGHNSCEAHTVPLWSLLSCNYIATSANLWPFPSFWRL